MFVAQKEIRILAEYKQQFGSVEGRLIDVVKWEKPGFLDDSKRQSLYANESA